MKGTFIKKGKIFIIKLTQFLKENSTMHKAKNHLLCLQQIPRKKEYILQKSKVKVHQEAISM